jgi:hypothetical protein
MRPMTFITGVILGSSGALGVVLGLLIFFRWVLTQDSTLDQTVVLSDLPLDELVRDMLLFLALTGLALAGFLGELFQKPWRGVADYLLLVAVTGVIIFFFAAAAARVQELAFLAVVALALGALLMAAARLGLFKRVSAWFED